MKITKKTVVLFKDSNTHPITRLVRTFTKLQNFSKDLNAHSIIITTLLLLIISSSLSAQEACDTLIFKSGSNILITNLLEQGENIQYQKCGDQNQKTYQCSKDKILEIRNATGPAASKTFDKTKFLVQAYRNNGRPALKGSLYQLKDSSVVVSNQMILKKTLVEINIKDLDYLSVWKSDSHKRGLKFGASIGLAVGAITGAVFVQSLRNSSRSSNSSSSNPLSGPDFSDASPIRGALLFGGLGALSGGVIGYLTGFLRTTITIKGDQKRYEKAKKNKLFF